MEGPAPAAPRPAPRGAAAQLLVRHPSAVLLVVQLCGVLLHPDARPVVMIRQLAGLAYVALFVSRLVGLTLARHR